MYSNSYIIAEYKVLRGEINHHNTLAFSASHLSVGVSMAIIGYLFQLKNLNPELSFIPFLTIIPPRYIIIKHFQWIFKIRSYIKVFLEEYQELYKEIHLTWLTIEEK